MVLRVALAGHAAGLVLSSHESSAGKHCCCSMQGDSHLQH